MGNERGRNCELSSFSSSRSMREYDELPFQLRFAIRQADNNWCVECIWKDLYINHWSIEGIIAKIRRRDREIHLQHYPFLEESA